MCPPCFSRTGRVPWRPPSLDWVPVSRVPQHRQDYEGARKNHYGSRSLHGPRVAASFYSLIESAKMVGVEPAAYLREATHRALHQPGTVTLPIDFLSQ